QAKSGVSATCCSLALRRRVAAPRTNTRSGWRARATDATRLQHVRQRQQAAEQGGELLEVAHAQRETHFHLAAAGVGAAGGGDDRDVRVADRAGDVLLQALAVVAVQL